MASGNPRNTSRSRRVGADAGRVPTGKPAVVGWTFEAAEAGLRLIHKQGLTGSPARPPTGYLTLTYLRRTRGRGSPANTLPNLSTVPNSAPLPVVVPGLPP